MDAVAAGHPGKRLTLRFRDEMRFGQKGRARHRWFARGRRPPGLRGRRHTWAHPFAAVQPATGAGSALVSPEVSTAAMRVFLEGFAATPAPDEHATLVIGGAGWHVADARRAPESVTLALPPPCAPESNPVERVWPYLRERCLSHRRLADHGAIVDALCSARQKLTRDRLRSLTDYPCLNQVSS